MISRSSFRIVPVSTDFVEATRGTLSDTRGHPLQVATLRSSAPCRFTLRQMQPGEQAILMSYSPFLTEHPYKETGPIYITAQGGSRYGDIHRWPPEIDPLTRVFRAYSAAEEIVDARVGIADPEALVAELFANPAVDCIHVRSLTYGCFTFKIERA